MKRLSLKNIFAIGAKHENPDFFYLVVENQQAGPFNEKELKILVKNGTLVSDTLVWSPQLYQWTQARLIPCINKLLLLNKTVNKKTIDSTFKNRKSLHNYDYEIRKDLISAIVNLGFKLRDTQTAVDNVLYSSPDISLNDGIKEVLKKLC